MDRLAHLRHRLAQALGQGLEELGRPQLDEAAPEVLERVVGPDGDGGSPVDGAGVEPLLDGHEAHPGLGVTGQDGPLDRCGPPPPGQQREVDVDQGQAIEDRRRNQPPVGDDHAEVDAGARQVVEGVGHP